MESGDTKVSGHLHKDVGETRELRVADNLIEAIGRRVKRKSEIIRMQMRASD